MEGSVLEQEPLTNASQEEARSEAGSPPLSPTRRQTRQKGELYLQTLGQLGTPILLPLFQMIFLALLLIIPLDFLVQQHGSFMLKAFPKELSINLF